MNIYGAPRLNREEKERAFAEFMEDEERQRLNPNNMFIRIFMVCTENFYTPENKQEASRQSGIDPDDLEDWSDNRRLYALHLSKSCNIFELKARLLKEFGHPTDHTHIYFQDEEMNNNMYLADIPNCRVSEGSILTVMATGKPTLPFDQLIREKLSEIKISDVRYLNTSERMKPWTDW